MTMGHPKGVKLSEAHKAAISKGLHRAVANGWRVTNDHWAVALAKITPEHRAKATSKAAATMKGRAQSLDKVTGAHTNNQLAKFWRFQNKALGVILEGKNLNQLIRDHPQYFEPNDIRFDKNGCNAGRCLRYLANEKQQKKQPNYSWKGWTI